MRLFTLDKKSICTQATYRKAPLDPLSGLPQSCGDIGGFEHEQAADVKPASRVYRRRPSTVAARQDRSPR